MSLLTRIAADRKLNEITGGLVLSEEFKNTLSLNGLNLLDGYRIYNQIKDDIKDDKVQEDDVPIKVQELMGQLKNEKGISKDSEINQDSNIKRPDYYGYHESAEEESQVEEKTTETKEVEGKAEPSVDVKETEEDKGYTTVEHEFNPEDMEKWVDENKIKALKFLLNQEHNIMPCPMCGAIIVRKDKFCYKCGCDVSKPSAAPTENVKEEKPTQDENIAFKFAYVLYLDSINKYPGMKIANNKYLKSYGAKVSQLKKQATEDGYLEEGNPLAAAKKCTVKDLKAILKEHDLLLVGKKAELIQRLAENLTEEELKKEFPSKLTSVNDNGIKFIEDNRYVFYYDKSTLLKDRISVDEYESIFIDVKDLSDLNILKQVEDYLLHREDFLVENGYLNEYVLGFYLLNEVYNDLRDANKLLDNLFKIFIASINTPGNGFIDEITSANLINILNALRLDANELKRVFDNAYDGLKLPGLAISKEESFAYLLRVLAGEDIGVLTEEIRTKYGQKN